MPVDARARTIADVIERMHDIDAALPSDDGVAYFNRMYLKVTEAVQDAVGGVVFENADFLDRLDVVFANLYFTAVEQDHHGEKIASAWRPLFESRTKPDTWPIQFALAGMNAHINHDLVLAVVGTCRDHALIPDEDTPHHRDYTRTNNILEATKELVKSWFEDGLIASLDRALGKIDDALAMWSIKVGRELAWENSQVVWRLDDDPLVRKLFLGSLARGVGFAGRGILL
jgi:hypothetical protein